MVLHKNAFVKTKKEADFPRNEKGVSASPQ
jgi:hypothetical protein